MSWTNQKKMMTTNCMKIQNKHTTVFRTMTRNWENWDYSEWIDSDEIKWWDEMKWKLNETIDKTIETTALWHTNNTIKKTYTYLSIIHLLSSRSSYIILTSNITKDDETRSRQVNRWREKKEYGLKMWAVGSLSFGPHLIDLTTSGRNNRAPRAHRQEHSVHFQAKKHCILGAFPDKKSTVSSVQAGDSEPNIWQAGRWFRTEYLAGRQVIQNRISGRQAGNSGPNIWQAGRWFRIEYLAGR